MVNKTIIISLLSVAIVGSVITGSVMLSNGHNETETKPEKVTTSIVATTQANEESNEEIEVTTKQNVAPIEDTTLTEVKKNTETQSTTQVTNISKEKSVSATTTTTKAPQTTTTTNVVPKNERDYGFANSLCAQFNAYRSSVGLNQLSQSGEMQEMAMRVAERIVNDFNHTPGDHSACNVSSAHARGEVIQYTSSNSPSDALQSFKNSSSHNATLLSDGGVRPLTGVGVGVVHATDGLNYICILTYTDNSYYG